MAVLQREKISKVTVYRYRSVFSQFDQGLKCNFKVVGTVKNPWAPEKSVDPFLFCSGPPVFLVRPLSLTKSRLTISSENLRSHGQDYVSGSGTCVPSEKKTLFKARGRQTAVMAGLGTAFPCVPAHFNP